MGPGVGGGWGFVGVHCHGGNGVAVFGMRDGVEGVGGVSLVLVRVGCPVAA